MKKILSLFLMSLMFVTIKNVYAEEENMEGKKVLVAYFSATGTTAGVAEKLAKVTQADLFEIKPEQPYTDDDLNWRDKQSRSSVEMADTSTRPAIATKVENMEQYDVVFVGFPIWWYREPSIIDTFMESYDFSGKIVVPFATSGGSGMGRSSEIIQSLAPQAKVMEGKRFSAYVSEVELDVWVAEWL